MNNNYDIVYNKLNNFLIHDKIPNIIFYGNYNTIKEKIVLNFLDNIYKKEELINKYVMFVDCAHGKGIKFVREEVKYFAKINIGNKYFKTIVLFNADKLTIDAQSALRRCIEIFSHSTRFFMIVNNISKLLNPILSRFCSIYIHDDNNKIYNQINVCKPQTIDKLLTDYDSNNIFSITEKLYNKGIMGLNLLHYIEYKNIENKKFLLFYINKIKTEIRNEKLFILIILNLIKNGSVNSLTYNHFI